MVLDVSRWQFRATVLLLSSFSTIGVNVQRDAINALQVLMTRPSGCNDSTTFAGCCSDCLGLGDLNYNAVHGVSFVAATAALAAAGLLLDRLGNWVIALPAACGFVGSSLYALGGSLRDSPAFLPCMFAGAAWHGLGFMSSLTCRDRVLVTWFRGREVGLALGVATCVNRLGALGVFCLAERLREAIGLQRTLWTAACVSLCSLLCAVAVGILDACGSRQLSGSGEMVEMAEMVEMVEMPDEQRPLLRDVRSFGPSFWLLTAFNATRLAVDHAMQSNLTEYVHEKFRLSKQVSAIAGGALVYSGCVSAPVAGIILDATDRPSLCLLIVAALLLPSFALVGFSGIHPIATIIVAGSLTCFHYVASVAAISLVVPARVLGTALSIVFCLSTLCDGLLHLVVGAILGREKNLPRQAKLTRWNRVMTLVQFILFASFCFATANYYLERRRKRSDQTTTEDSSSDEEKRPIARKNSDRTRHD